MRIFPSSSWVGQFTALFFAAACWTFDARHCHLSLFRLLCCPKMFVACSVPRFMFLSIICFFFHFNYQMSIENLKKNKEIRKKNRKRSLTMRQYQLSNHLVMALKFATKAVVKNLVDACRLLTLTCAEAHSKPSILLLRWCLFLLPQFTSHTQSNRESIMLTRKMSNFNFQHICNTSLHDSDRKISKKSLCTVVANSTIWLITFSVAKM